MLAGLAQIVVEELVALVVHDEVVVLVVEVHLLLTQLPQLGTPSAPRYSW